MSWFRGFYQRSCPLSVWNKICRSESRVLFITKSADWKAFWRHSKNDVAPWELFVHVLPCVSYEIQIVLSQKLRAESHFWKIAFMTVSPSYTETPEKPNAWKWPQNGKVHLGCNIPMCVHINAKILQAEIYDSSKQTYSNACSLLFFVLRRNSRQLFTNIF